MGFLEKCIILTDMSDGLLCRIYALKVDLLSADRRPKYLDDPVYAKFRLKVVKSYPIIPALDQV